eukprot:scaffold1055_cov260-Chaetoceros_neogracile.AAC.7
MTFIGAGVPSARRTTHALGNNPSSVPFHPFTFYFKYFLSFRVFVCAAPSFLPLDSSFFSITFRLLP